MFRLVIQRPKRSPPSAMATAPARPPNARAERLLRDERVVWVSSTRPDGRPHVVPIWFSWDGEALLIFSKPHARKVENLRRNPAVMLAFGDVEHDFDVQLVDGRAELLDRPTAEILPPSHLAKYAEEMAAIGLSPAEYAATYSQVIRVVPLRFLGWHGRTSPVPHTAVTTAGPRTRFQPSF
jgi:PPOX class probable F420-dependent enzyme